jgi:hypothetical protein
MDSTFAHSLVQLDAEQLYTVESARGRGVVVFDGKVWITQQGDPKDHIVSGGESFTFDHPGLALIEALEPARLVMLVDMVASHESIGYEAAWPQAELAQADAVAKVRYGLTRMASLPEAA